MKNKIIIGITVVIILGLIVCGFIFTNGLSQNQIDTLIILTIICGSSALYCFVVGEISRNNSQMDKLWSLLPIAYTWIIAGKGGMTPRLIVIASLVTLWGLRLTFNFARKGAYSIKFWSGEEDYRWVILRNKKPFDNKFIWALFNLFFISIYQNALVLAICLPALAVMDSMEPFGWMDYFAAGLTFGFLLLEIFADEEQWVFQTRKWKMIKEGKKLEELPEPYNKGFNTFGLWNVMRHPNYLGEQGIWLSLYLFVIAAKVAKYGIFNWTMVGPLLLVLLFLGSSTLGESISSSKYVEYQDYQKKVFKYLPIRKYR